jgi:hypothetical protein
MNDNLNQTVALIKSADMQSLVCKVSKAKTGAAPKTNAERQKAWRVKKSKTHVEFNVWVRLENLDKAKKLLKQLG